MAVNVVQSAFTSRRFNKWLPWAAGLLLVAGVIAFMVAYFGNTASPAKESFGSANATKPQVVKEVPIAEGARVTAAKFILARSPAGTWASPGRSRRPTSGAA